MNLRPRGRWELALVVSMLVCVGVMVASEIGYSRAQVGHDRIVREIAASAKLSTLLSLVTDAETSQRGHLLTERANYLEAFERAMPRIEPLIGELHAAYAEAADPSLLADFDTVVDALRDKLSELELTIGMAQIGRAHV